MELDPLVFQKSVELAVRADAGLSTELVKHLGACEILCLKELAWQTGCSLDVRAGQLTAAADKYELNVALVLGSPPPPITMATRDEVLFLRKLFRLCDHRLQDFGLQLNASLAALQLASATVRHCLMHLRQERAFGRLQSRDDAIQEAHRWTKRNQDAL